MLDSDSESCTPPDITSKAKNATANLLPTKSRERYEIVYKKFMEWRIKNKIKSLSENVLLAYFDELANQIKPSSLWATYSMLRATLNINNSTDISSYAKLVALLKRKSDGYKCKKSKILSTKNIEDFLQSASDDKFLLSKVILIFGISGACRKQELRNINPTDIEDTGKSLIINIPNSKTKKPRSFLVSEEFYPTCKKYINLRPPGEDCKHMPFFLNYRFGKCTKQCVGINKIGYTPQLIAEYLKLPDAKSYTGHCFRRSSATILADAGGDLLAIKRHGGWQSSSVAESYVDQTIRNKTDTSIKIASAINNTTTSNTSNNMFSSYTINTNETKNDVRIPPQVFNNCTVSITNNYYYEKN